MTALLPTSKDYTDKDFDAVRLRARNLISSVFPDWTDDSVANFGNIIVELFCFMLDVLTKYENNSALDTRWGTARTRKALINLVKMIGFTPRVATAAQATETFTLTALPAILTLPAGTLVSTLEITSPIAYQLLTDLVIPAGHTTASATVENSVTQGDTFSSNGLANQTFQLTRTPYVDSSAIPTAGNGVYVQVANLLSSGPNDRHFVVAVDSNDRAKLLFGNGINGAIPQATISVAYKTGGGSAGRVERDKLTKLQGSFADANGNTATISCTNPAASVGGLDRQSNAQIQALAPIEARANERSIVNDDFEAVALKVPGVVRALMTTSNEDPAVQENRGILYVVPDSGGAPPQQMLDDVAFGFVAPPTNPAGRPYANTFGLTIYGAPYLAVDVIVKAYRAKGVTTSQLKAAVLRVCTGFFAPVQGATLSDGVTPNKLAGTANPLIDFGFNLKSGDGTPTGSLAWSDVFDAIRDAPEVRKLGAGAADLLLNGERADVPIAVRQFPQLGSVTVIDGDTGAEI